jgi:hypothetical protein
MDGLSELVLSSWYLSEAGQFTSNHLGVHLREAKW